ncbi:hypothetical protein CRE_18247 [Caenorhabditis remanei]|uniref:Uncharacterized protein n=1 Tax=Caenorhabditis remanei TaxID=31234 RepID=E3NFH4_CAERE|nr:hypothetical protein CRE_18247 [Caenorhabditis remanei]
MNIEDALEQQNEIVSQNLAIQLVNLEASLLFNRVEAPKIIDNIVDLAQKIPNQQAYQESARLFAENMKYASVFRKRESCRKISKLNLTTKVIIIQQFLATGLTTFPMELCLSKRSRTGTVAQGIWSFQKPRTHMAMAFGLNKNGRLGIGSEEEWVDVLTPVELSDSSGPVEINQVFIGPNHTIIQSKNGNLYGCGIKSNFLSKTSNSEKIATTPIDIRSICKCLDDQEITLGETYTKFEKYDKNTSLIVGTDPFVYSEHNWSGGTNLTFVNRRPKTKEYQEIEVETYEKQKRKVKIIKVRNDCLWVDRDGRKPDIAFIVNGSRVHYKKLMNNFKISSAGEAFALIDHNVHKGRFVIMPRKARNDGWRNNGRGEWADESDEVLLCIMEEIALPYAFDGLAVSDDGQSFIAWANFQYSPESYFKKYRAYERCTCLHVPTEDTRYDGVELVRLYKRTVETDIKRMGGFHLNSGHPKYKCLLRGLRALIHFLKVDERTGVSEVLLKTFPKNQQPGVNPLEDEFETAIQEASKLPILVTKSDINSEEREKEIVAKIIKSIALHDFERIDPKKGYIQPRSGRFNSYHCEESLKIRKKSDEPELNLELIRVEAAPIIASNSVGDDMCFHDVYHIYTTEFHIRCIDASLLEHVGEYRVLNLNLACLNDPDHYRFLELLDSFFLIRDDIIHLKTFDRVLGVELETGSLPEDEKYSIRTLNENITQVPKYLFELYSEYDSRRKEYVIDPHARNFFSLSFTEDALKLLVNCLIDVRVFFRANMKLKIETFALAKYLLMRHIWDELRLMIILSAEEKDFHCIGDLLQHDEERDALIPLIARWRPEIIIFWKEFQSNVPLSIIHLIAAEIDNTRYKRIQEVPNKYMPIVALLDENVDNEIISERALTKYLCHPGDDETVKNECRRAVQSWNS